MAINYNFRFMDGTIVVFFGVLTRSVKIKHLKFKNFCVKWRRFLPHTLISHSDKFIRSCVKYSVCKYIKSLKNLVILSFSSGYRFSGTFDCTIFQLKMCFKVIPRQIGLKGEVKCFKRSFQLPLIT